MIAVASENVAQLQAHSALVGLDLLPPSPDGAPAAAAMPTMHQQRSCRVFGAPDR